jgi:DNA-binding GntR family transcriptional regulator
MDFEGNKNSTSKAIYHELREEIINLHLVPGTSISEKEISEKYNVSRTPVREAFVRLSQEGLLSIYPQKGTFVSLIDLSAVEEGRFLREHLERAVIRQACEEFPQEKIFALEMNLKFQDMYMKEHDYKRLFEADEEFHKIIFDGCNKKRIWAIIHDMSTDFQRIRLLRLIANFTWDNIYLQHENIVDAIRNKRPEIAENTMKEHLNMVIFDEIQLKESHPNYFK